MQSFQVYPVGKIRVEDAKLSIELEPAYIPALQGLDGFSHLNIVWWFSDFDQPDMRQLVEMPQPYTKGPAVMGTFATRGPVRPNPIAWTVVQVHHIDKENGTIQIPYIDAHDGSPVLDIKPYTPSEDRLESPTVPDWCSHWPKSNEASEAFDWESEFTF